MKIIIIQLLIIIIIQIKCYIFHLIKILHVLQLEGFTIHSTFPFKDKFTRNLNGGIGIIEMLKNSNILALIGSGKYPKYNKNKVYCLGWLWTKKSKWIKIH